MVWALGVTLNAEDSYSEAHRKGPSLSHEDLTELLGVSNG
jgi:hypothetical protein